MRLTLYGFLLTLFSSSMSRMFRCVWMCMCAKCIYFSKFALSWDPYPNAMQLFLYDTFYLIESNQPHGILLTAPRFLIQRINQIIASKPMLHINQNIGYGIHFA